MALKTFLAKHGTALATGGSIILTVVAVVVAIKKAKEGAEIKDQYSEELENADGNAQLQTEAKISYAKNLVRTYKWAIVSSCGAIVLAYISHRSDAKRIADLGAALMLSEEKIEQLYRYSERKLLPMGQTRKDLEKDIVETDPNSQYGDVPIKAHRKYRKEEPVNFKDSYSGIQFESTLKDYESAVDRAEFILRKQDNFGLNYNKWRNLLGLDDIPAGAPVGWKAHEFKSYLKEVMIDNVPYYLICYKEFPNSVYWK